MYEGVGVQNPKLLMFQGVCQPGNRQKWKVDCIHSDIILKTKVQGGGGGCNEIEILWAHVMDYDQSLYATHIVSHV